MTPIKHIITFVLMLLAFGLTAKAQNSLTEPLEGTTHTYTCNGISDGASYAFYMTSDFEGLTVLNDVDNAEFDFSGSLTGNVDASGLAAVDITWNVGAASHKYYLRLEATLGGCSNNIMLEITPQVTNFDVLTANVPKSNTLSCPSLENGFDALSNGVDMGITELQFDVIRKNGTYNSNTGDTCSWSFVPELTVDPNYTPDENEIHMVVNADDDELTPDTDGRYTVNNSYRARATVYVGNYAGTDLDVKFKVKDVKELTSGLTDGNAANDSVMHTIQVIPVIDGMDGI